MEKIRNSLKEDKKEEQKFTSFLFILVAVFLGVILILVYLNTYVFFNVIVDGDSMNPTLKNGNFLVGNKKDSPNYGDIVIIQEGNKLLIKRVIALGGDEVKIQNGKVFLNGQELQESYTQGETVLKGGWQNGVIPKGYIFFLGDNRENSADARSYGPCKEEDVVSVITDWSISCKNFNTFIMKIFSLGRAAE